MSALAASGRCRSLLAALACGAACFAGVEISLRLGWPETRAYRMHRDISLAPRGPRALVLGDSFSLDDKGSFALRLRGHLSERGWTTLNLARSGFGPKQQLAAMRRYGLRFRPGLVFVDFYVGNDTSDTLFKSRAWDPVIENMKRSYALDAIFEEASRLVVGRRLRRAQERLRRTPANSLPAGVNPFVWEVAQAHPDYLAVNLLVESAGALRAWKENELALLEIDRLTRAMGARLVVNIFPSVLQVEDGRLDSFARMGFAADRRLPASRSPQEKLKYFCAEHGLTCLDLLPAFASRRGQELYRPWDEHWTNAGHQLAFETVRARLEPVMAKGIAAAPERPNLSRAWSDLAQVAHSKNRITNHCSSPIESWPPVLEAIYCIPRCLKPGFQAVRSHSVGMTRFSVLPLPGSRCGLRSNGSGADAGPAYGVALGDSLTAGEELSDDETYVAELSRSIGRRFLNMGVAGQGLEGHRARWREVVKAGISPKVVIIQLCANDLEEDAWVEEARIHRAGGERATSSRTSKRFTVAASRLAPFASYVAALGIGRLRGRSAPTLHQQRLHAEILRSLRDEIRAAGATPVFLADERLAEDLARSALGPELVVRVDVGRAFRLFYDGHWNAAGHRLVAEHLRFALRSAGLIPSAGRRT